MLDEDSTELYKAPKTVKLLYQNLQTAFQKRQSGKLCALFKELYCTRDYSGLSAEKWNSGINLSLCQNADANIGFAFAKVLDLIREFHALKTSGKWDSAFEVHMRLLVAVLKCLQEMNESNHIWLKALRVLIRATKNIFYTASNSTHLLNTGAKLMNDLLNTLQRYKAARGLNEDIKKEILPLVDIMQVSILLTFHNYEQIQRIIYSPKFYGLEPGPRFVDNYLFQKGKYALINENIKEAEECFERIKIRTKGQKRLLLKYLIPCKIFLGRLFVPKENAEDERLPEYQGLSKAIRNANFAEYNSVNSRFQKVWLKRGIYLLMDRLRIVVWRNLLKKLYRIYGDNIDFEIITKAVALSGGDEKLNECICIVGNLIYEGYAKGYIFQNETKRVLVLKTNGAFQPLAAIAK